MTITQAKNLTGQIARAYLGFGRKISDIQRDNLLSLFAKWDYDLARRTLSLMDVDYPPPRTQGYLPEIKLIKDYYDKVQNMPLSSHKLLHNCPCCANNRTVVFRLDFGNGDVRELSYDCSCWLNSGREPTIKPTLEDMELDICHNQLCMNRGKAEAVVVDTFQGEYWSKFLDNCRFCKQVIKKKLPRRKRVNWDEDLKAERKKKRKFSRVSVEEIRGGLK
jgi:hypothetical protein